MSHESSAYSTFVDAIRRLPQHVGSISEGQRSFLRTFLEANPTITNVLETGFNLGLSAATILDVRPSLRVVSADIFWFHTTAHAKQLLDLAFPGRHLLLAGNSVNTLPTLWTQFPTFVPDMVFVDGGHEPPIPFLDLLTICQFVPEHTWILVDDYCNTHGSHGVIPAVDTCVDKGYVEIVQEEQYNDRGWILLQRTAVPIPETERDPAICQKALEDTESHYPKN